MGLVPAKLLRSLQQRAVEPYGGGGTGTAHGNGTNSATVLMRVVTDISARRMYMSNKQVLVRSHFTSNVTLLNSGDCCR